MRQFRISDLRRDPPAQIQESLAGVITKIEMSDVEVDELADLDVGASMEIDRIRIERVE